MPRILITAFEPFLDYPTNASMQILQHWQEDRPGTERSEIDTEILPVNYQQTEPQLAQLHTAPFDFALHLGQSHQCDRFHLEMVALNLKHDHETAVSPLSESGPVAFTTTLPLTAWCEDLNAHDLPSRLSFHAGTYLCNATYFWSSETYLRRGQIDRSLFVHVPLIDMNSEDAQLQIRRGSRMLSRLVQLIESHLESDASPLA